MRRTRCSPVNRRRGRSDRRFASAPPRSPSLSGSTTRPWPCRTAARRSPAPSRTTARLARRCRLRLPPSMPPNRRRSPAPAFRSASSPSLAPLLMAGVMVVVLGNPVFAIFALLSPVLAVGGHIESKRRAKKGRRRDAVRWAADLAQLRVALADAAGAEVVRRRALNPDPAEVRPPRRAAEHAALGTTAPARRLAPAPSRNRRRAVGRRRWPGSNRPPVTPTSSPPRPRSPCCLGVRSPSSSPTEASSGSSGARPAALAVARSLLVQATVHHGPADLPVLVACDDGAVADWDWSKWLPHVGRPERGRPPPRRRPGAGRRPRRRAPRRRPRARSPPPARRGRVAPPTLLAVVDGDGLLEGRRAPTRNLLAGSAGPAAGIVVAATVDQLPAMCTAVVVLDGDQGDAEVRLPALGRRLPRVRAAGLSERHRPPRRPCPRPLRRPRARRRRRRPPRCRAAPRRCSVSTTRRPRDLRRRWADGGADPRPVTPLGVAVDGVLELDLVADGPHGLVAGTTGAGKSELLAHARRRPRGGRRPRPPHVRARRLQGRQRLRRLRPPPAHRRDRHRPRRRPRRAGAALPRGRAPPPGATAPRGGRRRPRRLPARRRGRRAAAPAGRRRRRVRHAEGRAARLRRRPRRRRPARPQPRRAPRARDAAAGRCRVATTSGRTRTCGSPCGCRTRPTRPTSSTWSTPPTSLATVRDGRASASGRARWSRCRPRSSPRRHRRRARPSSCGRSPSGRTRWPATSSSTEHDGPSDLDRLVDACVEAWAATGRPLPRRPWPDPLPLRVEDAELAVLPEGDEDGLLVVAVADDPDRQRRVAAGWRPAEGNLAVFGVGGSGTTTTLLTVALALGADPVAQGAAHLRARPRCRRARRARRSAPLRRRRRRRRAGAPAPARPAPAGRARAPPDDAPRRTRRPPRDRRAPRRRRRLPRRPRRHRGLRDPRVLRADLRRRTRSRHPLRGDRRPGRGAALVARGRRAPALGPPPRRPPRSRPRRPLRQPARAPAGTVRRRRHGARRARRHAGTGMGRRGGGGGRPLDRLRLRLGSGSSRHAPVRTAVVGARCHGCARRRPSVGRACRSGRRRPRSGVAAAVGRRPRARRRAGAIGAHVGAGDDRGGRDGRGPRHRGRRARRPSFLAESVAGRARRVLGRSARRAPRRGGPARARADLRARRRRRRRRRPQRDPRGARRRRSPRTPRRRGRPRPRSSAGSTTTGRAPCGAAGSGSCSDRTSTSTATSSAPPFPRRTTVPMVPGRGFVVADGTPRLAQFALPSGMCGGDGGPGPQRHPRF